jgi:hypothetical protein
MSFYDSIELTPEELQAAILDGKKRKYFKEKNQAYWESQERPIKPKLRMTQQSKVDNQQTYS